MYLYNSDAENSDRTTELAVALKKEALTKNPDVLKSFKFVDFIVSSTKMEDPLAARGIGGYSSDVTGTYSRRERFVAYIAVRIQFDYFYKQTEPASSKNESTTPDGEQPIVDYIIGNGFCPPNIPTRCQNGKLRENVEYWYTESSAPEGVSHLSASLFSASIVIVVIQSILTKH